MPDLTITVGDDPVSINLAEAFSGSALVFTGSSAAENLASVSVDGYMATITAVAAGTATVIFIASNTQGTAEQMFMVTVKDLPPAAVGMLPDLTITVGDDPVAVDVAQAFAGSALMFSAVSSAERMGAPASSAAAFAQGSAGLFAPGSAGPFGGWAQPGMSFRAAVPAGPQGNVDYQAGLFGANSFGYGPGMRLGGLQQLNGMSFAIPMNAAGSGSAVWTPAAEWTFWGHVDRQAFDGDLTSIYVGADANFGDNWLAGVALSRSSGDADYKFNSAAASGTGDLDTDMVSVLPYVRWSIDDMAEVWAIAGAGWGDVDLKRSANAQESDADLSMWMLSAGGRRTLASGDEWNFALTGDAGILEMQTDGGTGIIDDMNVSVGRVKLGLEGERVIVTDGGDRFAVFGQVGGRHDSGDGETGSGVELMGGVRYDTAGRIPARGQGAPAEPAFRRRLRRERREFIRHRTAPVRRPRRVAGPLVLSGRRHEREQRCA